MDLLFCMELIILSLSMGKLQKIKVGYINYIKLFNSVEGFSIEFASLNPNGFFFYSFYSIAGFIDPHAGAGTVELNDLFFALHAFCLSCVQFSQIFVFEVYNYKIIIYTFLLFELERKTKGNSLVGHHIFEL